MSMAAKTGLRMQTSASFCIQVTTVEMERGILPSWTPLAALALRAHGDRLTRGEPSGLDDDRFAGGDPLDPLDGVAALPSRPDALLDDAPLAHAEHLRDAGEGHDRARRHEHRRLR